MRQYQEEYLSLLQSVSEITLPPAETMRPEDLMARLGENAAALTALTERGTELLRRELFPVLDDILAASEEETGELSEFARRLTEARGPKDTGLSYRIHLALLGCARRRGDRDMLIRELYEMGISLNTMQTTLTPCKVRLYNTRMRMCFAESASHFEKDYDEITDPETRGYIHRSMGNIPLCYDTYDDKSAMTKLEACTRSIRILSDPDVRAKTPSLPWDRYLYISHQQRTGLLSYLRSGNAGHQVFAQVLESAQIVQEKQMRDMRERGEPLHPRWQYAYLAALYHSGAMRLTDLLDGIYGLCSYGTDDDFSPQSTFAHLGAPAYYMEYSRQLPDDRLDREVAGRIQKLTARMLRWLVRAPEESVDAFALRQFIYAYRELSGCMPFAGLVHGIFAARYPARYIRHWITGRMARLIAGWCVNDRPEQMVGPMGTKNAGEVQLRREELLELAEMSGSLCDVGMIHFIRLENDACRGIFEEEEELFRLHAHCGAELLSAHPSTGDLADVARGHHCHYDGRGGYPLDFSPQDSAMRPIICIASISDAIAASVPETATRCQPVMELGDVFRKIDSGAGTVYSPAVTGLLTPTRRAELENTLRSLRKEACLDLYARRASLNQDE